MSTAIGIRPHGRENGSLEPREIAGTFKDEGWYAAFTVPKHEKSVLRYLDMRGVEAFLPTYEVSRIWRNRQRVKLALPLFPCYVFVRTNSLDYGKVRQSPGIIRLVGNRRGPLPLPDSAIAMLRASVADKKVSPYSELAVGTRVRVRSGPMQGLEGVLVRKKNGVRFVLTLELINQHAAIEIGAENLEAVPDSPKKARASV